MTEQTNKNYCFKIIITEPHSLKDELKISAICHKLAGEPQIFDSDKCKISTSKISEGKLKIEIEEIIISSSNSPQRNIYILNCQSTDYKEISIRRSMIVSVLKKSFKIITLISDDISKEISSNCYKLIYDIENSLRGYISKFMIINVAPKWFGFIVPEDINQSDSLQKNIDFRNSTNYSNNFIKDTQHELFNMIFLT